MTQADALQILKMGYSVFLTGSPGSGKTYLLNKYVDYLKSRHKAVAVTASTGIAATHIDGVTLHSWSGLGIKEKLTDKDIRSLMKKPYLMKRFKETNVLVIDEISMLNTNQFGLIDRICQYFKGSFSPFGGMQVVCSGDLFQLPPIDKKRETTFIVESYAWKTMDAKICYLEEQHRHKDKNLSDLLRHIRNNDGDESKRILLDREEPINSFLIAPTKLCTHNIDVDDINNLELSKINGKEFSYQMTSVGQKDVVAILKKNCLAPERLALKRGAQVMFLKNNFNAGYVNGTQGKVIDFNEDDSPVIETFTGRIIIAKPAGWVIEEKGEIVAQITQIPIRLAWAITVHKSQGMNLDTAEIDLSKCFVEGMGYVALSRLRSLAGLKLVAINDLAFRVNKKALALDGGLKQMSQEAAEDFRKMTLSEKRKKQKQFLDALR